MSTATTVATQLAFVSPAHAADTGLQAAGTIWTLADDLGTSNGQTAGDTCVTAPAGTAVGLRDAVLGPSTGIYDTGALLWVGGVAVGGTAAATSTTTRADFTPVAIGGLTRQVT